MSTKCNEEAVDKHKRVKLGECFFFTFNELQCKQKKTMSGKNNIRAVESDILISVQTQHNSYIKLKAKIAHKVDKIIVKFVKKNILTAEKANKISNKAKKHFIKKLNSGTRSITIYIFKLIISELHKHLNERKDTILKYARAVEKLRVNFINSLQ